MIKLSDYIFGQLRQWGAKHIFLVTGGGAMHLNDSIGTSGIKYICTHHEQAAAMAAEGYARISNTPGLLNVTSGPGSINALNGVFGAWTDSIPMLILSGQVKRETCMQSYGITNLRQLGDQEVDIIRMVKGITKYAVWINEPETIAYHLERAWTLARNGRPGPCWLDIPVDVQAVQIDETKLRHYDPKEDALVWDRGKDCRAGGGCAGADSRGPAPGDVCGHGGAAGRRAGGVRCGDPAAADSRGDGVDARSYRLGRRVVLRAAGNDRRARRELYGAELGRAAGAGIAAEHSPDQLQLGVVCAVCHQNPGGCGCGGVYQADAAAGCGHPLRPEGLLDRDAAPVGRRGDRE